MRVVVVLLFSLLCFNVQAQSESNYEKYPVFPECESVVIDSLPDCFTKQVQQLFKSKFQLPQIVIKDGYEGEMNILFEVTEEGAFKVIYTKATYAQLKQETERVFNSFPKIQSATFDGNNVYSQFSLHVAIPSMHWISGREAQTNTSKKKKNNKDLSAIERASQQYDSIVNIPFKGDEKFTSGLQIPLSHQNYSRFDKNINVVGTNFHTAAKPYYYADVNENYDFEVETKPLLKSKTSWFGRKFWNEHMIMVKGKQYWFTADIVADLQLGKDLQSDKSHTYNNTRAVNVQGGLGKKINFYATVFESQGRFADYVNAYAESIKPDGGNPAIIPGRGIAKAFRSDSYDYPLAEGYVSYRASKMFNAQFGHGKNFIGDGYRSLLVSDVASPYPYLKLNTSFWKIKYTNTWMWLKDVRPGATVDGAFGTKYMATHYLSWNVTKKLNIGFFESVLWADTNNRGFDINYLNPVIFYRAIEFSTGSRAGNALIGLTGKYKINSDINVYSQLIIDEFSSKDIFGSSNSWKNKLGYQLGVKYYDAFKVKDLMLQVEYNQVRPYTYSHDELLLNYGHNNQSMAHLWGANFREVIGIARYRRGRWFGTAKLVYGQRGLDTGDGVSYGGDVFVDNDLRPSDNNINLLQGNKTDVLIGDLRLGYLVNPATNLKIFANVTQRNFSPATSPAGFREGTTWINLGFRTDLFNWYFDF